MLARWWRRHARDADCGTVTAEFAVVLPCVAAVAILVLCLGRASIVSMNCQDAAAAGARAMAIDAGGEAKARRRGANHCRWRFHGVVRRQCQQRHRCGALPGCGGSDRRAARQRRGQGNSVFLIAMFMTACCP